jgi:hypothetical protein
MPSAPPALAPEGPGAMCYACRAPLEDPLILCCCGCRLPLHPLCYAILITRQETCPACRKLWVISILPPSNSSVASTLFPEVIQERPLSQTECVPACSTRWMVYSLACLIITVGGLFLFFYFIK